MQAGKKDNAVKSDRSFLEAKAATARLQGQYDAAFATIFAVTALFCFAAQSPVWTLMSGLFAAGMAGEARARHREADMYADAARFLPPDDKTPPQSVYATSPQPSGLVVRLRNFFNLRSIRESGARNRPSAGKTSQPDKPSA